MTRWRTRRGTECPRATLPPVDLLGRIREARRRQKSSRRRMGDHGGCLNLVKVGVEDPRFIALDPCGRVNISVTYLK